MAAKLFIMFAIAPFLVGLTGRLIQTLRRVFLRNWRTEQLTIDVMS
jgi:hypothetical protein